jgi:hypothetical protein
MEMTKIKQAKPQISQLSWAIALLVLASSVTGCFENNSASKFTSGTNNPTNGTTNLTNSGIKMYVGNVTIATGTGSAASTYQAQVFFNTTDSQAPIATLCSANTTGATTSANACVCTYSWVENNTQNGSTVPVTRSVQEPVTAVGPGSVTCNAPDAYASGEIVTGTIVQVGVSGGSGNGNVFTVIGYNYTRIASGTGGSFQDAQGNSFENVDRYACFEQSLSGSLASSLAIATNPGGGTVNYPMASQFCVQNASDTSANTSTSCTGQLPGLTYSSQSYYHNLYIQDSEVGDINYSNQRYFCPQVKESLGSNNLVGTQGKVWPLDKSFALSLGITTTFTVGVEAFSALSDGTSDPVSQGSVCPTSPTASPSPGPATNGASLVENCLGFAATPNTNGSCPSFRDSNNVLRYTYRLRRFISLYPPIFDANGLPMQLPQPADTIYVLDRPVQSTNTQVQYTMYGPKPCPFSYFDKTGVTVSTGTDASYPSLNGRRPRYLGTGNAAWSGTNVNGIQIPNVDSTNSCSAVVGVLGDSNTIMSLATVNAANPAIQQLYIRPVTAWSPHYIEDTSFQACAPQASTPVDPPLHFAKDPVTGNVGWCAEAYPTQNENLTSLDIINGSTGIYGGDVAPYTSHAVKNTSSGTCTPTPEPSVPVQPTYYPTVSNAACSSGTSTNTGIGTTVKGLALHPSNYVIDPNGASGACAANTCKCASTSCDRTVSSTPTMTNFPLLAPAPDVEAAMTSDISDYGCIVSYDNGGPKTGKLSPTGGCCGSVVNVITGNGSSGTTAAHLEPDVSCLIPTY